MASNAAADSGEACRLAASTTDQRVGGKACGVLPVAVRPFTRHSIRRTITGNEAVVTQRGDSAGWKPAGRDRAGSRGGRRCWPAGLVGNEGGSGKPMVLYLG